MKIGVLPVLDLTSKVDLLTQQKRQFCNVKFKQNEQQLTESASLRFSEHTIMPHKSFVLTTNSHWPY